MIHNSFAWIFGGSAAISSSAASPPVSTDQAAKPIYNIGVIKSIRPRFRFLLDSRP